MEKDENFERQLSAPTPTPNSKEQNIVDLISDSENVSDKEDLNGTRTMFSQISENYISYEHPPVIINMPLKDCYKLYINQLTQKFANNLNLEDIYLAYEMHPYAKEQFKPLLI